jgi:hypothetical protein
MIRSRCLRDRFSSDDLQVMTDLYRSGTTARQVAEKFRGSLSSVKRVLRQHGVHRGARADAIIVIGLGTCTLADLLVTPPGKAER